MRKKAPRLARQSDADDSLTVLQLPPSAEREELNAFSALAPPVGEVDHFYLCETCGQAVDRRRLGDVLYHEEANHEPLSIDDRPAPRRQPLSFIEPMQPALVTEAPEGDVWLHELKYDGYRTQLIITPDDVRAFTRRGHDWTDRYAEIVEEARRLHCDAAIMDGEAIVQGSNGVCDFHGLQHILRRKKPSGLTFMAFDLLHLNGEDLRSRPVEERRALLSALLGPNAPDRLLQFSDHVVGHGEEFFKAADALGLEGIVSKRLGSRYRSGSGKSWLKVKAFTEGEFVVIGAARGDLAPVALLARETEDHRLEYAGAAMVTFSERERERFWRAAEQLKVDHPALQMEPRANTTWLRPQMRVRVRHLRGEEKLRHATLVGIAYLPTTGKPSSRPKAERSREPSVVRPQLPAAGEIKAYMRLLHL